MVRSLPYLVRNAAVLHRKRSRYFVNAVVYLRCKVTAFAGKATLCFFHHKSFITGEIRWFTGSKKQYYREKEGILQVFGGRVKTLQRAGQRFVTSGRISYSGR